MLRYRYLLIAMAAAALAMLTGCASVGAPLPPSLELLKPPTDLRAARKGNRVYLSWTVPTTTMDRQSVRHRGPTRICRSPEVAMASCGTPIASIAPESLPKTSDALNAPRARAEFVDELPRDLLSGSLPSWRDSQYSHTVTYAVEALNSSDRSPGLSNQVQILLAPTVTPPDDFHAQLSAEGVRLTWSGQLLSFPESPVSYFYRVFRRAAGTNEHTVIGDVPYGVDPHPSLLDQTFAWEKNYEYWLTVVTRVRHICPSVTAGPSTHPCEDHFDIEGDDTPLVSIVTHDIYPPVVPTGLQAVFSGPGQTPAIDLLWAPDTDADLAGYNVYRREEGGSFAKINAELVKTPAYRDSNVASGRTYSYSVSAVDLRGNESARSDEASESVP